MSTKYIYEIRKAGSNCSGVNFRTLRVGQNQNSDSWFLGDTIFYPDSNKRTFTAAKQLLQSYLSPMGSNNPSNFCVASTLVYNTDTNGLVITFDGTDYLLPSGAKIGTSLDPDTEQYYATEQHKKDTRPNYFEDFSSSRLSYQSKRKRKRASQSFT